MLRNADKNLVRSYRPLRSSVWAIPLFVGFFIFFLITVAACVVAWKYLGDEQSFYKSFLPSLAASLIEDVLFFLLVGIIPIFIAFKSPARYKIKSRAKWLFNAPNVDRRAVDYLTDNIRKIAAYSPFCNMKLEFHEPTEDGRGIKTIIVSTRKFVNLFRDVRLSDFELNIAANSDKIYVDGSNGQLVSVLLLKDGCDPRALHCGGPLCLRDPFEKKYKEPIDPNGEYQIYHEFWVWYEKGEPFSVKASHWTGRLQIQVENKSNSVAIRLENLKDGGEQVLKPGESVSYSYDSLPASTVRPFALLDLETIKMEACPGTTG